MRFLIFFLSICISYFFQLKLKTNYVLVTNDYFLGKISYVDDKKKGIVNGIKGFPLEKWAYVATL